MEYPIIDTLADAYIRNGWTGLTLIDGVNKLPNVTQNTVFSNGITVDFLGDNEFHIHGSSTANSYCYFTLEREYIIQNGDYIHVNNDYYYGINQLVVSLRDGFVLIVDVWLNSLNVVRTLSDVAGNRLTRIMFATPSNMTVDYTCKLMISNSADTPFEPYKPPTTDIFSRTRLPLIRYFPHPVIDSLQRAADGSMTADDVQVLRHYLTKFGIGNIELGRFHAINPNVSDDIREIDLEPIPIDEPIKEKKTGEEDMNVKTE